MGSFDGLDVQVANTIVLADRRVAGVRQRAGALVAQPGDVILVSGKTDAPNQHARQAETASREARKAGCALITKSSAKQERQRRDIWCFKRAPRTTRKSQDASEVTAARSSSSGLESD